MLRFKPGKKPPHKKVERFKRRTWFPVTRRGQGTLLSSRFGGLPYLKANEKWPLCPNCGKPLTFFFQLDLENLPEKSSFLPKTGLIQLFYCTSKKPDCELKCKAWQPFSKSVIGRFVAPDGENKDVPKEVTILESKVISNWKQDTDYPDWEELPDLGIKLSNREIEEYNRSGYPEKGDKYLGWPDWVQSKEYPLCPKCGRNMEFVFQLDSKNNLDYSFGDEGCGHITVCPNHHEIIGFGWACG